MKIENIQESIDLINKFYSGDKQKTGIYYKKNNQTFCICGSIYDGKGKCPNCGSKKTILASDRAKASRMTFEEAMIEGDRYSSENLEKGIIATEVKLYVEPRKTKYGKDKYDEEIKVFEQVMSKVSITASGSYSNLDGRTKQAFKDFASEKFKEYFKDFDENSVENGIRTLLRGYYSRTSSLQYCFLVLQGYTGLKNLELDKIGLARNLFISSERTTPEVFFGEPLSIEEFYNVICEELEVTMDDINYLLNINSLTSNNIEAIEYSRKISNGDILSVLQEERMNPWKIKNFIEGKLMKQYGEESLILMYEEFSKSRVSPTISDLEYHIYAVEALIQRNTEEGDEISKDEIINHIMENISDKLSNRIKFINKLNDELIESLNEASITDELISNPLKALRKIAKLM